MVINLISIETEWHWHACNSLIVHQFISNTPTEQSPQYIHLVFLQHPELQGSVFLQQLPVLGDAAFKAPSALHSAPIFVIVKDNSSDGIKINNKEMLWGILQIFGYKCLGEGNEQAGGFFGGNVGNVEVHQARISDGVLNFPLLD